MQTENLTSLGIYLMNGNKLIVGQEVVVELKYKKLQTAKILAFKENFTDYNRLNMCRVCENVATIELSTGEILAGFPFSMILVDENKDIKFEEGDKFNNQTDEEKEAEYQMWLWKKGYDLQEEMDYFGEDFYE